jgi:putative component of membrane protein insertase Oxa1/YidC/SpoIIIJ protein YidD
MQSRFLVALYKYLIYSSYFGSTCGFLPSSALYLPLGFLRVLKYLISPLFGNHPSPPRYHPINYDLRCISTFLTILTINISLMIDDFT